MGMYLFVGLVFVFVFYFFGFFFLHCKYGETLEDIAQQGHQDIQNVPGHVSERVSLIGPPL